MREYPDDKRHLRILVREPQHLDTVTCLVLIQKSAKAAALWYRLYAVIRVGGFSPFALRVLDTATIICDVLVCTS